MVMPPSKTTMTRTARVGCLVDVASGALTFGNVSRLRYCGSAVTVKFCRRQLALLYGVSLRGMGERTPAEDKPLPCSESILAVHLFALITHDCDRCEKSSKQCGL
ncbi:hypothetical protein BaRGS_00000769 [Batillaria attramentaria]|uniref:Uncharacterized protein n=1 Tax=Batillaria attramentaria TaxID=370345 RepID=A0ABD0M8Q4_9CAEN